MVKVSAAQASVLKDMQAGATLWRPRLKRTAWLAPNTPDGDPRRVRHSTVQSLLQLGLIDWVHDGSGDDEWELTGAGWTR